MFCKHTHWSAKAQCDMQEEGVKRVGIVGLEVTAENVMIGTHSERWRERKIEEKQSALKLVTSSTHPLIYQVHWSVGYCVNSRSFWSTEFCMKASIFGACPKPE